jgi:hypothetical protein
VRLAKAENKRTGMPLLCSFNVEAFGWMFTESGMSVPSALAALWRKGAADLRVRLTPDPAEVSPPIKVADRDAAIRDLEYAASQLEAAKSKPWDEEWVSGQLAPLWPEFIARPGETSKARLATAMKNKSHLGVTGAGLLSTSTGTALKHPRSFGD